MLAAVLSRLVQVGVLADETLNVELDGDAGQTLSLRAALAARSGERWACVLCRVLGWLVQRRHCEKQLMHEPMNPLNYVRAAACIMVCFAPQVLLARWVGHVL